MLTTTQPRKNDPRQAARLDALEAFNDGLKANSLNTKRDKRAIETEKRQRVARSALVDSKRKMEDIEIKPPQRQAKKAASAIVKEELVASTKEGGLDLSDLSYQQIEALKEYGGLTGNMTREQVEEIVSRVSPMTDDATPFVISTPLPKKRFLSPRRQYVYDIETGKKILL
jgi:hypothetical protein